MDKDKMDELKRKAKLSNRYSFISEHRGGNLTHENHRLLIGWAIACSEHVLLLVEENINDKLLHVLQVAKDWKNEKVATGIAMKASLEAHAVARESSSPVMKAIARSIGQTVATAHMADHSLGGAFYALKAVKLMGKSLSKERSWQIEQLQKLPLALIDIVETMWNKKVLDRRI